MTIHLKVNRYSSALATLSLLLLDSTTDQLNHFSLYLQRVYSAWSIAHMFTVLSLLTSPNYTVETVYNVNNIIVKYQCCCIQSQFLIKCKNKGTTNKGTYIICKTKQGIFITLYPTFHFSSFNNFWNNK